MKIKTLLVGLLIFFFLTSHFPSFAQKPEIKLQQLPSGRIIKMIPPLVRMKFMEGGSALMLKYMTDIKLENTQKLREEAEDIWLTFRYNVEKLGYKIAIIAAYEPFEEGIIFTENRGYMFRIEKQKDGSWKFLDKKPNNK